MSHHFQADKRMRAEVVETTPTIDRVTEETNHIMTKVEERQGQARQW